MVHFLEKFECEMVVSACDAREWKLNRIIELDTAGHAASSRGQYHAFDVHPAVTWSINNDHFYSVRLYSLHTGLSILCTTHEIHMTDWRTPSLEIASNAQHKTKVSIHAAKIDFKVLWRRYRCHFGFITSLLAQFIRTAAAMRFYPAKTMQATSCNCRDNKK